MERIIFPLVLLAGMFLAGEAVAQQAPAIRIGVNAEFTGDIPQVGESTVSAARMWAEEVNGAGGLAVGGRRYPVALVVEDNGSRAESAATAAAKLIAEGVIAVVGPQASKQAVPAGAVCNSRRTPMISPWSTNPDTTKDRPYVFRACFLDDFQGPAIAIFAKEELKFTRAAVLYDRSSDYPRGLAGFFRAHWEKKNGPGSVAAYESFTTGETDFSAQLSRIIASGAEFLFAPQYYNEVPLIVRQAKQLGWNKPILGSDTWASAELVKRCGSDCTGFFFVSHYAPAGAKGATREFIDRYRARYGSVPDDVAALTWDAIGLVGRAIGDAGEITGDVVKDREAVRNALSNNRNFPGITGAIRFSPVSGDPVKCANIVKINDRGEFEFFNVVCP